MVGKRMMTLAAWLCASAAVAQVPTPTYDLTGVWERTAGGTLQIFQRDGKLSMILIGPEIAHHFEATYTTQTTAVGRQVRVTRASGCATNMLQRFTPTSAEFILVDAIVLDSNCDLVKGQVITDALQKLF
jgi:hypothetical protein